MRCRGAPSPLLLGAGLATRVLAGVRGAVKIAPAVSQGNAELASLSRPPTCTWHPLAVQVTLPPAPEVVVAGIDAQNNVTLVNTTAGLPAQLDASNTTCSALPCTYAW